MNMMWIFSSIVYQCISADQRLNMCKFSPMTTSISGYVESRPPSLGHCWSECGREGERALNLSMFDAHFSCCVVMFEKSDLDCEIPFGSSSASHDKLAICCLFQRWRQDMAFWCILRVALWRCPIESHHYSLIILAVVFVMLTKHDLFMSKYDMLIIC